MSSGFNRRAICILLLSGLAGCAMFAQAGEDRAPLTLDAAIEIAIARAPRVAAQHAAIRATDELIARAGQLPDPKLRFGIENLPVTDAERFRVNSDFMTMRRIGVMQEIPSDGKRASARARAHGEGRVERGGLARERAQVRALVASAWIERHYARRVLAKLEELRTQIRLEIDAAVPALAAGRVTLVEVQALRAMAEAVGDRVLMQDRLAERARIELLRLIADAADRPAAPIVATDAPPWPVADLDSRMPAHPQVIMAASQLHLAQADIDAARATVVPDWSVELSYAQREPAYSNMISLMVQVDLPLWRRDRQDRDVASRVAQRERALAQLDDARRLASAELRLAYADHAFAHRRVQHHEHVLVPVSRERLAAASAAYRGGRGTLAAVLEARRAELEIDLETLAAERERALAWSAIRYAFLTDEEHANAGE